jgi:hypothetical protein
MSLAADTCHMAKKPQPPSRPTSWTIYKIAAKAVRLGTVEAPDEAAAIRGNKDPYWQQAQAGAESLQPVFVNSY